MYLKFMFFLFFLFILTACGGGSDTNSISIEENTEESLSNPNALKIVSTPNPSVFPLLVALAEQPNLPVELIPVSGSSGIDKAFLNQQGEGLLAMSFVIAKKVTDNIIPNLQLQGVYLWREFSEIALTDLNISNFMDFAGKNIIVSGPVGTGKNGGPDIIFLAALQRSGVDITYEENGDIRYFPESDITVFYLPVMDAIDVMLNQTILDDGDGDTSNDQSAIAILLIEPASTGLMINALVEGVNLERAIDLQSDIFTGYSAWLEDELPIGGVGILKQSLVDKSSQVESFLQAYQQASEAIMAAKDDANALLYYADLISQGLDQYYSQFDIAIPGEMVMAAIQNGHLVYRTDRDLSDIAYDLNLFIEELVTTVPADFYNLQ